MRQRYAWLWVAGLCLLPVGFPLVFPDLALDWKAIEIIAILVGGVAVIAASREAFRFAAKNRMEMVGHRPAAALQDLRWFSELAQSNVCRTFQKSENSPATLDADQALHDAACPWFRDAHRRIVTHAAPDPLDIMDSYPQGIDDPAIDAERDMLARQIDRYNQAAQKYRALETASRLSGFDEFLIFVIPTTLALYIGLSLMKAVWQ